MKGSARGWPATGRRGAAPTRHLADALVPPHFPLGTISSRIPLAAGNQLGHAAFAAAPHRQP